MILKKSCFYQKIITAFLIVFFMLLLTNCSKKVYTPTVVKRVAVKKTTNTEIKKRNAPATEREFRAVWIASVANINWPSKRGLSTEEQQKEAIELLDLLHQNNFNTVILQVRPQADAMYKSDLEPWSYYLTGTQGKAPSPYYDPLEFWIYEAHKRGLELHAWLNPYRAHHTAGGEITEASIVHKNPKLVAKLETGFWWLDPGNKKTQEHSYKIVMDIVQRYNVDGIHFDDYFYPYPSYNNNKDFPDDKSWKNYLNSGGQLKRDDWRRDNVNTFIEKVYTNIKKAKPSVKFGISPFGFWRPNYPASVTAGFDQYSELYADAKLWLNKGWIDYLTPQLYWPINRTDVSFPVLLNWWNQENTHKRHLWPGMSIGRIKGDEGIDEVINQIMITKGMLSKSPGAVHWSIAPLIESPKLMEAIANGPYKKQALVPGSPWLHNSKPEKPTLAYAFKNDSLFINWSSKNSDKVANWVVRYKYNNKWDYSIHGRFTNSHKLPLTLNDSKKVLKAIAISVIDKFGNESLFEEIPIAKVSTRIKD
ncbi:glycoside hydrolase family 10 protein [Polaribacter sp. IC073]|uniref:glycoside hydrolase family 10 protein n=1 Tax=Polaribacter sp. IC073 TaxID=2508540 RepID=UPI0011BF9735|nr:family 10 glycosylhydrolase [Polaribacter sp. IC073]TXD47887.1 family 10 glycosylhydrolase [Polaribacter sp. IC073]